MKRALKATLDYIKRADMFLLSVCCICTIFGCVLIWSATQSTARGPGGYLSVQIAAFIMGIGTFVLFSVIDVEIIANRWQFLILFSTVFFLILWIFGEGDEVGSRSWLRYGSIGIQPAEVVKIIFIITMSYHIHYLKEYKDLNSFLSVVQLLAHFGYIFGLMMVVSRDLGLGLVYLFIFVVMLFLGGLKLRWFLLGGALLVAVSPLIFFELLSEYQQMRILAPYFPEQIDPTNTGYNWQAYRSQIAIASGQWTGKGLGQGEQTQSGIIPEQQTDFIFSVAGEELGLIGCLAIIALLATLIIRCFYVSARARNTMSGMACAGVGAMLLAQTVENIGMCIGLTPVIGITLPLFSYGGTSIITTYMAMGIVCGVKMRTVSPWKRQLN